MADWSQLPNDLLQKICQKLNSELYLLRFGSVCSSWRRASFQNCHHNHLPSKLPQLPYSKELRRVFKQNIFLIKPPATLTSHHHRPWLVRIGPDANGKTQMWHPFDVYHQCPLHFTDSDRYFQHQHIIDFNQMPVIHLGHIYIHRWMYEKVIAVMCEVGQPLAVLTYDQYGDKMLKIFRCEDNSWTTIPTMPPRSSWGDICIFKGRPCVADKNGRTLMIRENFSILLLANPVFGGNMKFLVESECDLLLVDCEGTYIRDANKDIKFDVFKLDEKEKKWIKLTTLGDKVLFVDEKISFSASASDLHVANGNCIIYCRNFSFCASATFLDSLDKIQSKMRIFHLDQGRSSRLSRYSSYIKLFRPPPKWILGMHNSGMFSRIRLDKLCN